LFAGFISIGSCSVYRQSSGSIPADQLDAITVGSSRRPAMCACQPSLVRDTSFRFGAGLDDEVFP
jgi:hypothetical protein